MRAKKSLGQNFLHSPSVVKKIISTAKISSADTVLEIGPGKGVLTKPLLEQANKIIAVEKDNYLYRKLEDTFFSEIKSDKLSLINEDNLKFNITVFVKKTPYKIVANIPYNITGLILRLFLSHKTQPTSITLMVQKEVAERIVARDGKESILSISVKTYGTPRYIEKVPARYFSPKPKVDSAIIHIDNISKKHFENAEAEVVFFSIVKTGFMHKRKTLVSNLSLLFEKKSVIQIFENLNIKKDIRAEKIPIETWFSLYKKLSQTKALNV